MLYGNYGKDFQYTVQAVGLHFCTWHLPRYAMHHAEEITGEDMKTQAKFNEFWNQKYVTPQN